MAHFDGDKPVSFAQSRYGEVIVTQGYGKRPQVYRPSKGSFRDAGFPGPGYGLEGDELDKTAPSIAINASPTYYVARLDILDVGSGYTKPPIITMSAPPSGGVQATAIARIAGGGLSAVEVTNGGRLYTETPQVSVDGAGSTGSGLAISIVTEQDPDNQQDWHYIKSATVLNGGSGYLQPPVLWVVDDKKQVYGQLPCTVENGAVVSIDIPDPSVRKYGAPPPVGIQIGNGKGHPGTPASVLAIMRATLRGKYQCYYRWVDNTVPKEEGGPLYSNLSPVTEVNAGHEAGSLTWTIPVPPPAGVTVELWRSSSDQATTLYRVTELPSGDSTFVDDLNDHELTDPDREKFMAMPIILPNGELNANRFGVPPSDYAVAVMFQDRLWMSVDTTGTRPNHLRFSEMDEPESMPDVNELIVQQNLRSGDYITALIPYAGALVVCQSRHSHRLTYVSQPLVDVGIFMLAYRGCLNQRCWDIYEGRAYILDEQGVYSLDPQGQVESLTVGLDNIFQSQIDWSKGRWFIVRADRRANVLRVSVAYKGESGKYPTRQLVYSFDYKSWWEERYPVTLVGAADARTTSNSMALIYGSTIGKSFRLGDGLVDYAQGAISSVKIENPGYGYTKPPRITARECDGSECSGAEFTCSLDTDGRITGVQIRQCGTGYKSGNLTIDPPPQGGEQAAISYEVHSGEMPVHYAIRTGNMEFVSDSQDRRADREQPRQVSMVYQPTQESSVIRLETYYNGASYPRSNTVRRDRGVGFVHSDTEPAATLDMQATLVQSSESHGVARALFAGRTLDDMDGSDRHIAIGLSGTQSSAGHVVIHSLDVYGVNKQGE